MKRRDTTQEPDKSIALSFVIKLPFVLAIAILLVSSTAEGISASPEVAKSASKEWTLVGGDLHNTRYSSLVEINRANVSKVRAAWVFKNFDEGGTSRVPPVVSGGLMFVTAGRQVYALDAKTGAGIWKYKTVPDRAGEKFTPAPESAAVGVPNWKGVATGGGMVFVGLQDGHIIGLTEKTGRLVWSRQTGGDQPKNGQWASAAPIYANGIVFEGLADGDYFMRGRFTALDAQTGRVIWQKYTIPGPGEPGHETWPSLNSTWKTGGGGVWTQSPVDTELSLVYFATGNPVPAFGGDWRQGDNLYTCSVLAIDIRTGELRWYYQAVHHDVFEADIGTPVILYDTEVAGVRRKALALLRADGYLFQLDRETGKPILPVEERQVPQLASQKTSATQPFPVGGESILRSCDAWKKERIPRGFVLSCSVFTPPAGPPPSTDPANVLTPFPGARASPMAYSPQTGYFYVQAHSWLGWARRSQDPYFVNWSSTVPGLKHYVDLVAIDSRTDKVAWRRPIPTASFGGGPLATAGGLLFRSSGDGNVEAYDAATGELLWQFQTGMAGALGAPVTYEIDGEQYVAVAMGPAIWAFTLGGKIAPVPGRAIPTAEDGFFSGPTVETADIETTSLKQTLIDSGKRYFIDEYTFNPYRARVPVGSPVLFINNGTLRHEIVALDGSWGSGPLDPSEQAWVTFTKPGEYTYICKDHPWSYGQIIVSPKMFPQEHSLQGKEQYNKSCSICHGDNLLGHSPAPALVGDAFLSHWENASAAELLDRIQSTMPQGKPGSLDRETYLQIVAYILQVNRITVGTNPIDDTWTKALKLVKLRRVGKAMESGGRSAM